MPPPPPPPPPPPNTKIMSGSLFTILYYIKGLNCSCRYTCIQIARVSTRHLLSTSLVSRLFYIVYYSFVQGDMNGRLSSHVEINPVSQKVGHWLDMVNLPPRGDFVDYILIKAQCLARIWQHVSPLTMEALSCNSLLHTLPTKFLKIFKTSEKCKRYGKIFNLLYLLSKLLLGL